MCAFIGCNTKIGIKLTFQINNICENVICRKEIDSTLDRLKKVERDLTLKEKQLKQRESKLKERERNLEQQFKVVVYNFECIK